MVVALGPGKFYGSSLPRPRIYTEVKLSDDGIRVDPPLPVLDPFLTWANDAHWSMGGLSFKRHRLQGRIEGNIKKLRAQQDMSFKRKKKQGMNKIPTSSSVPPSFLLSHRRRALLLNDDDADEESEEEEEEIVSTPLRKSSARRLGVHFDKSVSADATVASSITTRKGKSKGLSDDSPVSVETSNVSPSKKRKNKINEPTKNFLPQSSTIRGRRALLLNDDDPEKVEEEPESPRRLQKNKKFANEKTTSVGVAFRTRSRRSGEDGAPAGARNATKRR